eukprot:scaffold155179_cov23-Tisochrysis_lutea.AAC.1
MARTGVPNEGRLARWLDGSTSTQGQGMRFSSRSGRDLAEVKGAFPPDATKKEVRAIQHLYLHLYPIQHSAPLSSTYQHTHTRRQGGGWMELESGGERRRRILASLPRGGVSVAARWARSCRNKRVL